jgi:hypothetical protein
MSQGEEDRRTASGVRWLLLAMVLAASGNLVSDVPFYFGTTVPELNAVAGTSVYQQYAAFLNLAVLAVIGVIGLVGILRIERNRSLTGNAFGERSRRALLVAFAAAAFLFCSGLALEVFYRPLINEWNPVRVTARFVVVLALGIYLLETAARIGPGSPIGPAKSAVVLGTFAAAVRMLVAIYNGLFGTSSPSDFVTSEVEPLLSPAAFVVAMIALFTWIAIYGRILGRLVRGGAERRPRSAPSDVASFVKPIGEAPVQGEQINAIASHSGAETMAETRSLQRVGDSHDRKSRAVSMEKGPPS